MIVTMRSLCKDLGYKLDMLQTNDELALCVMCSRLHSSPNDGDDFGRCPDCGDDTSFAGQVSLSWIKDILNALKKVGPNG